MSDTRFKASLLASTMITGLFFAAPARAQDAASQDATNQEQAVEVATPAERVVEEVVQDPNVAPQDIVVTGSRIVRRDLETAAPVAVVQDEEFKLSGTVNVEQVINTLPQAAPGGTAFSNNPGGGVATLNLRGLGSTRTLVLVNGRRWMFYDPSQIVDLNTIPSFLLDSVDVVTGGASAVYGSDAVAGVVNFRLRNDIQGVEVGGGYSITERGDGRRYNTYVALGGDLGDRGHATVFGEYYNRGSIFQGDRAFSQTTLGGETFGEPFGPSGSSTNVYARIRDFFGATGGEFTPGGRVYRTPGGPSSPANASDIYNYAPSNYLMVPQERYVVGGYADYDIGGGHSPYVEATFVNNRVANELAPTPVTGIFDIDVASACQFVNATECARLQRAGAASGDPGVFENAFIQRRIEETGPRNSLDERNAFRLLAGVRGPITDRFNYDAYYSYARTRNSNVQQGNISRSAFAAGLDGTASPINIFGPGTLTPEMVDQISILAQNSEASILQVANASVTGSLFNLGWGADDIGTAFGVEYRKVASQFIPDTALSSGDVIGFNAGDPTAGGYNVREAFAEVRVPIAARAPFAYKLELSGAARYSDYSLKAVGGVWTYAAGAEYAPVRDATLRGQYQRAVRAPNVGELFGGRSIGFPLAADPCAQPGAATDPIVRNLCIATGVPATNVGNPALQINAQIEAQFGGNPNLQAEISDSYTAGVVLRPSFLPGFAATVDWYNIQVRGAISTLGGGLANTLNLCYNVIQDINSPYCQVFVGTRNPAGALGDPPTPQILNANTAKLEVEGVDLQLDYSTRLPFRLMGNTDSRLNLFFLGTWTRKSNFTPVQDLPNEVNKCAGKFGVVACGSPTPKYKWTSRASLITGPLTSSLRWRHLSSVTDDDPEFVYFVEKINAYNLFDLSFAFDVTEQLSLAAGVNNLFDKKPPILGDNQEQANTYPGTYDVLGRDFFISARLAL